MNTTRRPYSDPRWQPIRRYVLQRDAGRCRIRLTKCTTLATEVDHIIDWRDGGAPFDPANLRAACKACNVAQRNSRQAARARAHRNNTTAGPRSRDW